MWKKWLLALLLAVSSPTFAAPSTDEVAELEFIWLMLSVPVINFATKELELPLDVIIQPDAPAGSSPVGMIFRNGRCKLVLSLRNNPAAHKLIMSMDDGLEGILIEAVVAHEIGHCWRLKRGEAGSVPPNFIITTGDPEIKQLNMQRREEGFADLVGLAWTLKRHPQHYEQVHAWFTKARAYQPIPGAPHDTRAWLRLAKREALEKAPGSIFEQAKHLWQQGLLKEY